MKIANAHIITKPQKIGNNNLSQHITLGLLEMHGVQDMFFFYHLDFLSPFVPKEILGYFVLP
jgi:hypothetical protein